MAEGPHKELDVFLLRSRRRAALGVAILCGILVVIQMVFIVESGPELALSGFHPARLWLLPVIVFFVGACELLSAREAGRQLRNGAAVSNSFPIAVAIAIGEAALPSIGILLFHAATDWPTALRSPPVFGYFLILMLAILRLDARICLLIGGVETVSFLGLIACGLGSDGPEASEVRATLGFLAGTAALIVVATGIAVAISRQTRRLVSDLIDSHEAEARAADELATESDAREKAEAVIWQKDRLLAILGHDLRAPLNGVSWLADLMARAPERFSDTEIRRYAGEIRQTSQQLRELIDNLLAWARCRTGQLTPDVRKHSAPEIADSVLKLLEPVFTSKGITVTRDLLPAEILADREILQIALRNILSNAAKFTPRGGAVSVSCRLRGSAVEISVSDSGSGVPAHVLSQWMAGGAVQSSPGTENEPGSGIGLLLCSELMRLFSGSLEIDSPRAGGTVVRLRLPVAS